MEELLELLQTQKPEVDFTSNDHLIEDGILDSFDIISLVSAINEEFDIQITAKDVIPENFNSAQALYELVSRLQEEA